MDNHNQRVGKTGQNLAKEYFEKQGMTFVMANYRTAHGEIDLIFRDGSQLVFLEVKTRLNHKFGFGESAITHKKIASMIFAAESYLEETNQSDSDWRLDAVIVERLSQDDDYSIIQFENINVEQDV